jgi:hypothetical protein
MPTIFVDTDNSSPDRSKRLYIGAVAGGAAPKIEEKMKTTVQRVIKLVPDFTTDKHPNAKGYALRFSVAKVEVARPDTKCTVTGSIVRYPATATLKRGKGEEMVTTSMGGSAKASGTDERAILDCVEAIVESLVTKSIPKMLEDFAKR